MTNGRNEKDAAPATRADIDELAQVVKTAFDAISSKEDLLLVDTKLTDRIDRLERGLQNVLDVVNDSNQLLRQLSSLPDRVERLERTAFPRA